MLAVNVPLVNEFEDVFPYDMLGLPPREIYFAIALESRMRVMLKAPHHNVPTRMKELEIQL